MLTIIGSHSPLDTALLNAVADHGVDEVRDAAGRGGRVNLWIRYTISFPQGAGQREDHEDMSLLEMAIRLQKPDVVRALLQLGANPYADPHQDGVDMENPGAGQLPFFRLPGFWAKKKNNPMRLVIKNGNTVMLQALLAGGVDANGPSDDAWCDRQPLREVFWYSPSAQAAEATVLLLNHGADETRTDADGHTVWDVVRQSLANPNQGGAGQRRTAEAMQPVLKALAERGAMLQLGVGDNSGGADDRTSIDATADRSQPVPGNAAARGEALPEPARACTSRRRVL